MTSEATRGELIRPGAKPLRGLDWAIAQSNSLKNPFTPSIIFVLFNLTQSKLKY